MRSAALPSTASISALRIDLPTLLSPTMGGSDRPPSTSSVRDRMTFGHMLLDRVVDPRAMPTGKKMH
jgi:hypothetical protein